MLISVHGVDTNYQDMGKGTPLVLLHGWGCTWEIWYPVIAELSKNYRLIIPDLPAFGESKLHSNEWNSYHYAQWLEAFIQKTVGDKKFALLGHSFGGKIAAIYAATVQPKELKELLLVDISGLPVELSSQKKLQEKMFGFIPASFKQFLPQTLKEKILSRFGAEDYQTATTQQRAIFKIIVKENIENLLPQIQTKTTLIWGEKDLDTPLSKGQAFARQIPSAQLITFPNAGHFPFIDEPDAFIKHIVKIV